MTGRRRLRALRGAHGPWLFVDQAVFSVSNLAITIYAGRVLGASGFGSFSLIYASFLVAMFTARAYWSERVAIGSVEEPPDRRASAFLVMAGRMFTTTAVAVAVASWVYGALVRDVELAPVVGLALGSGLVIAQDGVRQGLLYLRRARVAALVDTLWFVTLVPVVLATTPTTPASIIAAWVSGAGVSLVAGMAYLRWGCGADRAGRRLAPHLSRFGASLGLEAAVVSLGSYAAVLFLGLVDIRAAGGFRGAQVLFGPVTLLLETCRSQAMTERAQPGFAAFSGATKRIAAGLPMAIASITALLALLFGRAGPLVLGDSADEARPYIPLLGAAVLLRAVIILPQAHLKGQRRGSLLLSIRLLGAAAGLGVAFVGATLESLPVVSASAVVYPGLVAGLIWGFFAWSSGQGSSRLRRRP